jgi:hypothetical protein
VPHFILRTKTFDTPWLANLFVKGAVRLHGMPKTIIYDRDVEFVSYFWKTLWAKLGTKIKYSRAFHDFHPQTDSKTFLHGTLSFHKPSFAYNSLANRSIGRTPFEVAMGLKPRQPIDLVTLKILQDTSRTFLPTQVLLPPVLLSDFPSRVQFSVDLCSSDSGLIHRQAVPSAVLVRSCFEDYQFGKHGASSGGAGHAKFGRPSIGSVASSTPSGSLLRQAVVHSDAPALVRNIGGGPHFGKFGGPLGVSASIPPFQWVLFPSWPRPFAPMYGCPQFVSSRVFEVGESSTGPDPEERDVVYPRVVQDARSCFHTLRVSFLGSDEKGFWTF